jgi:molybdenum cofactor guanylyltransferase
MLNDATQLSCIILAGGRGTRAGGADKGLIPFNGRPLIEHVIEQIAPQVDDIIISANRNTEEYQRYSNKVITDNDDNYRGPLSGIISCLPYCSHELVLIVACDMPALPDDLTERLLAAIDSNAICIATVDSRHQLALLIHKDLDHSLQQQLDKEQLSLIRWVESLPYSTASFDDDAGKFANLNTL